LERVQIIHDLRRHEFDVLVGINLLREGLDIPEVSLVAILDADKEGFLRSERSLIQTCGRAARNVDGTVILYANQVTPAITNTVAETIRRREIQAAYNAEHGITPATVQSRIKEILDSVYEQDYVDLAAEQVAEPVAAYGSLSRLRREMKRVETEMGKAAKELAFEQAAVLRDRLQELKKVELEWL